MPRPLTSVELATFERLTDVGSLLVRGGHEQMRRTSKLTGTQYEILIRLRNAGGELRMGDIAHRLVHTASGLTYQVRQLEQLACVVRARDTEDERAVFVQITDEGRQTLRDQSAPRAAFIHDNVVAPLEPEEIEVLHRLLGKLQTVLRGEEIGGMLPEEAEALPRPTPRIPTGARSLGAEEVPSA